MEIIPAIDIINGRCVRLVQGRFDQEEVFSDQPLEMARHWQQQGAQRLHVVDLDGAREGSPVNDNLIKEIISVLSIPVQVGGGIREDLIIEDYLGAGADRVILGTAALNKPSMLKKAIEIFGPDRIVVGIDAREGKAAIKGWQETTEWDVNELITDLWKTGVRIIIYTDIKRDGMLSGPDLSGLQQLLQLKGMEIIASGGISSRADLDSLDEIGIKSAIVGKALYTGKLKLGE